jgi:hypothetical protein
MNEWSSHLQKIEIEAGTSKLPLKQSIPLLILGYVDCYSGVIILFVPPARVNVCSGTA